MKHFEPIAKKWKSVERRNCGQCGKEVQRAKDHFELHAHWMIKKKADDHFFCSLPCLSKWTLDDEDNE